jgi:molecular chaperone DnaK (HSP70)
MNENVEEGDYLLFLDFGGSTFDVSILQFFDERSYVIISNQHLGGNDFDNVLLDYCFSYLLDNYKINLNKKKI